MTVADRIRVQNVRVLSDNHYTLKSTTFEWRRADGEWQTQHRETYDRGNGATLLPYNLAQRTVVLVRQFRYPAFVNGCDDLLIEAAAGLLDNETPELRIRAEAEEEKPRRDDVQAGRHQRPETDPAVLAGGARPGPHPGQQASCKDEKGGESQPSGEPRRPAHGTDKEVLQVTVGLLGPHRGDLAGRDQRDQEREDQECQTKIVRHD